MNNDDYQSPPVFHSFSLTLSNSLIIRFNVARHEYDTESGSEGFGDKNKAAEPQTAVAHVEEKAFSLVQQVVDDDKKVIDVSLSKFTSRARAIEQPPHVHSSFIVMSHRVEIVALTCCSLMCVDGLMNEKK